jgi:signal peptide peptidase SppA
MERFVPIARARARGEPATADELNEAREISAAREHRRAQNSSQQIDGSVFVLPIHGVLIQRASMFSDISGASSMQSVSNQLQAALADETVSSILLDIDSPGGCVFGLQELGDEIFSANASKPVLAIANSLAASAAYWLGSQASEFHVTPSGQVGSIGVYMAHDDLSGAMEDAGIKTTLVSAGKFKTEGNPFEPLDPQARAHMQSQVDGYYQSFIQAVSRGRSAPANAVRSGFGQGRVLSADNARSANMVDSVSTFGAVLNRARQVKPGPKRNTYALDGNMDQALRRARAGVAARARDRHIDLIAAGVYESDAPRRL